VEDPWLWWSADPEMQMLLGNSHQNVSAVIQPAHHFVLAAPAESSSTGPSIPQCVQCRHCRRPFVGNDDFQRVSKTLERHESICAKRHCEHCCTLFKTALECQGHVPLCVNNVQFQRCEFCTVRFKTAAEKRKHEPTCELNPAMCCEFCGRHFGHIALRNRHMQGCPQDPQRNCVYCKQHFPSRPAVVSHEIGCRENPATRFREGECGACCSTQQCLTFPCGEHCFCVSCLSKMLGVGLKDRSLLPLRCCKKMVEIGDEVDITLSSMLPEKGRLKYQEAMMLHGARQVMYCPNVRCGILIILDAMASHGDVKAMRHGWHTEVDVSEEAANSCVLSSSPIGCPRCQQAICFKCRSEWHEGMTCPQYQFFASKIVDEVTKFCRKMGWMRCFDCGHVVEKKAGCNHITCFCGSQFCYLCGGKWGSCKCQIISEGHALRHNRGPVAIADAHRCPHCTQPFDSAAEMRVHVTMCQAAQAIRGAFECATCQARFAEYGQYRDHRRECVAQRTELRHFAQEDGDEARRRRRQSNLTNNATASDGA